MATVTTNMIVIVVVVVVFVVFVSCPERLLAQLLAIEKTTETESFILV